MTIRLKNTNLIYKNKLDTQNSVFRELDHKLSKLDILNTYSTKRLSLLCLSYLIVKYV